MHAHCFAMHSRLPIAPASYSSSKARQSPSANLSSRYTPMSVVEMVPSKSKKTDASARFTGLALAAALLELGAEALVLLRLLFAVLGEDLRTDVVDEVFG